MINLLAILAIGSVVSQKPEIGLQKYVNRDLTTLSDQEHTVFERISQKCTKESGGRIHSFVWDQPAWIKSYRVGKLSWLYLKHQHHFMNPGTCTFKTFSFDSDWNCVSKSTFCSGWRRECNKFDLIEDSWFAQPILRINSSVGFGGQKNSQLGYHPNSEIVQELAFDELGAHLIRLKTLEGEMVCNSYVSHTQGLGPQAVVGRSSKNWLADLSAADPVRQLSSMVWLAGNHLSSKDQFMRKYGESISDSKVYEALRSDPKVKERLTKLSNGANPWLKEQAKFTLKVLSRPFGSYNYPP